MAERHGSRIVNFDLFAVCTCYVVDYIVIYILHIMYYGYRQWVHQCSSTLAEGQSQRGKLQMFRLVFYDPRERNSVWWNDSNEARTQRRL